MGGFTIPHWKMMQRTLAMILSGIFFIQASMVSASGSESKSRAAIDQTDGFVLMGKHSVPLRTHVKVRDRDGRAYDGILIEKGNGTNRILEEGASGGDRWVENSYIYIPPAVAALTPEWHSD